jgi:hypothetical protein
MCRCVRRLGLRSAEAADLVQDVFAVLVQKLPDFTYDRKRSFRAWLRTVTAAFFLFLSFVLFRHIDFPRPRRTARLGNIAAATTCANA